MSQSRKILRIFFKIWVFNVSRDSVWQLVRRWKVQSRGDSEIFAAFLVTPSQVELLVAKNTWIKFSKFLSWVFWQLVLATCSWLDLVAKNACFMFQGQFLKLFNFPSTFLWLFIVFLISSLSQTHRALNPNLHCWSSLQPHSPRKRYGFLLSYSILHVYKCISSFLWDFVEFVCFAMIRT